MGQRGYLCPLPVRHQHDRRTWQSYYDHDYEICTPYYYSVWLEDPDVNLEFTVAEKSSFYRIAWNRKEQKNLMLAVNLNRFDKCYRSKHD